MEDDTRDMTPGDPLGEGEDDTGGGEGTTREAPAAGATATGGGPAGGGGRGRFLRSGAERVLGGVGGGLARYFGIDPLLVRLGLVGLAFVGGAGILLYVAVWLLVPADDAGPAARRLPERGQGRTLAIIGAAALALLAAPLVLGGAFFVGGALVPLALLALSGLATWWLVGGGWPARQPRAVLKAAFLGLVVLAGLHVLFFSAAWIAGEGGDGWIAGFVIAAGVALVAGAAVRRGRWLILPALTVALAAGFVAAADIELDGGYGDREFRPGDVAAVQDGYELAAGELTVDLRGVELPAGDTPLRLDVGLGAAQLLVPEDVCVVTRADVGMGGVALFDRQGGGIDVQWRDEPSAPAGTARLVVDADIGLGALEVGHDEATLGFEDGRGGDWDWDDEPEERDRDEDRSGLPSPPAPPGAPGADRPGAGATAGNLACDGAGRATVR
jgi:phage shock protein PspC (stress-responsive transcriptional regulator)